MAHVCFYVCCSDCVGVCGNVCCVAAVGKNIVLFSLGVLRMNWRKSHTTTDVTVCERAQIRLKLPHSIYGTKGQISLKVNWRNTKPENTDQPKCLGVTLDRTLSYKQHIHHTNMKVAHATIFGRNWQTRSGSQVQAQSETQHVLYVILSLNMQHQSGGDLITLKYWI